MSAAGRVPASIILSPVHLKRFKVAKLYADNTGRKGGVDEGRIRTVQYM